MNENINPYYEKIFEDWFKNIIISVTCSILGALLGYYFGGKIK